MTGNFIADDIPFKELPDLPEDIKAGIELHKLIDRTTDSHPAFRKARARLRVHHEKYAPVVLDILNDHLLSIHWGHFYTQAEDAFHTQAYDLLQEEVERLTPRASLHVQTLLEHRYLHAYSSREGLVNVLSRIDRRTRFSSNFKAAEQHLYEDFAFYTSCFLELYTDLKELNHSS